MEHTRLTEAQAREQVRALWQEAREQAPVREAYQEQMRDYSIAQNKAKAAQGELDEARRKYEALQRDTAQAKAELQNLRGLFTGKRRKELTGIIEHLEPETRTAKNRMEQAEREWERQRDAVPQKPVDPNLPDDRETAYRCAEIYRQAGLYSEAAQAYSGLRGYRDVDDILDKDADIDEARRAYQAQFEVGSTVTFGRYPQDEDPDAEPKPIEWYVLEKENGRARLVSKYGLELLPYNDGREHDLFDYLGGAGIQNVTWETCTLRRWLNDEFINAAFDEIERARVMNVPVKMLRKQGNHTFREQGNDTTDRVFLLGYAEELALFKLLPEREASICSPTDYARKKGGLMPFDKTCDWWLRGVGDNSPRDTIVVYHNGEPNSIGRDSAHRKTAVRPAIVVQI